MAEQSERRAGWEVALAPGRVLRAMRVPGRDRPLLGIVEGRTFLALAEFISDEDMAEMRTALSGLAFIPLSEP